MKKILIIIGAIIFIVISYILISPLLIDITADERIPESVLMNGTETMTLVSGTFVDADASHKVSGSAQVIKTTQGQILRFENLEATNGPDLRIYLATDTQATEFIDIGKNKATIGNVNYELPQDVDLEKYDTVLIWCRAFGVLFGSAELE